MRAPARRAPPALRARQPAQPARRSAAPRAARRPRAAARPASARPRLPPPPRRAPATQTRPAPSALAPAQGARCFQILHEARDAHVTHGSFPAMGCLIFQQRRVKRGSALGAWLGQTHGTPGFLSHTMRLASLHLYCPFPCGIQHWGSTLEVTLQTPISPRVERTSLSSMRSTAVFCCSRSRACLAALQSRST